MSRGVLFLYHSIPVVWSVSIGYGACPVIGDRGDGGVPSCGAPKLINVQNVVE